jgi:SP family arabinose:H+ symporter-like MFS transporter
MYIAEIAPARMRGRLVAVNQLAIVVGCFAAALVSYALATSSVAESWRWMFASACVPVVLLMLGLFIVPESPRWLLQKGRRTEALSIVARIESTDTLDTAALLDPANAIEQVGTFRDLLRPTARMGLVVAVGLAVFQQLTGASILFANAPVVFQRAGFYAVDQAIGQSVVMQVWCILCTVASMWLVDRIGRRPLLLVGLSAMMLGQIATGLAFQNEITGPLVVVILLFAIGSYVISLAPLAWLIMSEMFSTRLRSKGMAVASLTLWMAYFAGLQLFPVMRGYFLRQTGTIAGVFYCFAAVCLVALVFSLKLVPETKGRTLEEISDNWGMRPLH